MKRIYFIVLVTVLLLTACTPKEKNIIFTGVIQSVTDGSMMINTSDSVGFDKASVGYDKNLKLDFIPKVGQMVEIEILPQIRESYPVQVTAVKIRLKEATTTKVAYKKITAEQAKTIIDSEKGIIILDVRTLDEYNEGHIANAQLIPDIDIEKLAAEKLPNKSAKILIYCRSGRRSEIVARKLIEMGYTNIVDFGGIIDWKYDVVK